MPPEAVGRELTLEISDAGHRARPTYANVEPADNSDVNTQLELFRADSTPLDPTDNLTPANSLDGRCDQGPGRQYIRSGTSDPRLVNRWLRLCRVTAADAGQWFLQVKSSAIPGVADFGNGWNQFAFRASLTGSTQPAVHGVDDLSLFNNLPGRSGDVSATFYLAEVESIHAGKLFHVSLFDPGDGASGTYDLNVLPLAARRPRARTGDVAGPTSTTASGSTSTAGSRPTTSARRTAGGASATTSRTVDPGRSPKDRTVWIAQVIGEPVHLIE